MEAQPKVVIQNRDSMKPHIPVNLCRKGRQSYRVRLVTGDGVGTSRPRWVSEHQGRATVSCIERLEFFCDSVRDFFLCFSRASCQSTPGFEMLGRGTGRLKKNPLIPKEPQPACQPPNQPWCSATWEVGNQNGGKTQTKTAFATLATVRKNAA